MFAQATSGQQGLQTSDPNPLGFNLPVSGEGEQDYAELQQFLNDLDNIAIPGQQESVPS